MSNGQYNPGVVARQRFHTPFFDFSSHSVIRRLTLNISLIIAFTLTIIFGIQYFQESSKQLAQAEERATREVEYLSQVLSVPLWTYDQKNIEKVGQIYIQNEQIDEVLINDNNQNILFQVSDKKNDETITKEANVIYEDEILGSVKIVYSLTDYHESMERLLSNFLFNIIGALAMILVGNVIQMRYFLGKPMINLLKGMEKVISGDFNYRLGQEHYEEFNRIASTFNHMSEEVKVREEALSNREGTLRTVINTCPAGILVEGNGEILYANNHIVKILKLTWDEAAQKYHYSADIHYSHLDGSPLPIESLPIHVVGTTLQPVYGFNHSIDWPDGERIFVSVNAAPLLDEQGWLIATIEVLDDVTEKIHTQEKIQHLNTELEQRVIERTSQLTATNLELESFAYSVSHDLRAPLRGMDGFSHILLEDYGNSMDETGRNYLKRIRNASQRMSDLIDNLLMLSRVTRTELKREEIDLSDLAAQIVGEFRENDLNRRVTVIIAPDLLVSADPQMLRMLLTNLLDNAWKFTDKHPTSRIEIGSLKSIEEPVYFVKDDGVGFDMAYSARLFEPFQRLHPIDEFEGDGIGLAIAKRIVLQHGGKIWAKSHVEQGTSIYFTLGEKRKIARD